MSVTYVKATEGMYSAVGGSTGNLAGVRLLVPSGSILPHAADQIEIDIGTLKYLTKTDEPLLPAWEELAFFVDLTVETFTGSTGSLSARIDRVDKNGVVKDFTTVDGPKTVPVNAITDLQFVVIFLSNARGDKEDRLMLRLTGSTSADPFLVYSIVVTAPFSRPAARAWELHYAYMISGDQTVQTPAAAWPFPWQFPPYMIQGAAQSAIPNMVEYYRRLRSQ